MCFVQADPLLNFRLTMPVKFFIFRNLKPYKQESSFLLFSIKLLAWP